MKIMHLPAIGLNGYIARFLGILIAVVILFGLFDTSSVFAQKIGASNTSFSLPDNSSQLIQLQLDAPIICPQQAQVCNVVLNFNVSDPTRVSLDANTVTWNYNEWSQTRTLTVSAISSPTYNNGQTVTISAEAVSSSEYYTGYAVTLSANIPAPSPPNLIDQSVKVIDNGNSVTTNVLNSATNYPDSSTLSIVSGPYHGTASDPAGNITYTPNKNYVGSDSLVFSVCSSLDSSICSSATLSFEDSAAVVATPVTNAPDTGFGKPNDNWLKLSVISLGLVITGLGLITFKTRLNITR